MKPIKYLFGATLLTGLASLVIGLSTCKTEVKAESFNEEINPTKVEYNLPKAAKKNLGKLVKAIEIIEIAKAYDKPNINSNEQEIKHNIFIARMGEEYEKVFLDFQSEDYPECVPNFRAHSASRIAGLLCEEGYCSVLIQVNPKTRILGYYVQKEDQDRIYSDGFGCLGRMKKLPEGIKTAFVSYIGLADGTILKGTDEGYVTENNEIKLYHRGMEEKSFYDESSCSEGEL